MIEIYIFIFIVICVAIGVLVLRKTEPNGGGLKTQGPGNGEEKVESGSPNQKDRVSSGDVWTRGTLPDSGYQRAHESQKDSVSAKDSQPPSTSSDYNYQHVPGSQKQSDSGEHSPRFKTFDELSQHWFGQEYDDSSRHTKTPGMLPNSGNRRAHGSQKQSESSRSTQTQRGKSSLPWENGSGYYPLDPARYVLGEPNIQNHRSKRYARRQNTFWR